MKHSKGPWHSVQYGPYFIIQADEYYGDTQLLSLEESPNAEANAKLAAAAPELLDALEKIRGLEAWITDGKIRTLFQETVYPAIEKAIS